MLGIHNLNPKHSESKTLPNIATTYGAASFLFGIYLATGEGELS